MSVEDGANDAGRVLGRHLGFLARMKTAREREGYLGNELIPIPNRRS